jgi:hypothetical protein
MVLTPAELTNYEDLKFCTLADLNQMKSLGGFSLEQKAWIIRKIAELNPAPAPRSGLRPK